MFIQKKDSILKLSALMLSIVLASCGGSSGGYFGGGNTGGDQPGGGGGGEEPAASLNLSAIELFDVNDNPTQTISAAGVTAKVKVTNAQGQAVSGALVTFTGESVVFGTSNGSVISNTDGYAIISIKPSSLTQTGSYILNANAAYDGLAAQARPLYYSLQLANIVIADFALTSQSIKPGDSVNVTLKTRDGTSQAVQNNVTVNFDTTCGSFDESSVVSSNQGDVTVTYTAISANGKLCEGTQSITASLGGVSPVSLPITIAAIVPNSLVYTTSEKVNLVTKSSGSASAGKIEFTLYNNGTPVADKDVTIDLVRGPTDLTFVELGNRTSKNVRSDSNGKVVVNLYPGYLPGPVEIKASLPSKPEIFVLSKDVAVATGRVVQGSLSLSATKNSLNGRMDGDTATITARLADRLGNAVPDGTVVSFIAEGGSITPNCSTNNGACSVVLTTQDPRPLDNRVTVLAFAEGEKAYRDVNGDNMYTAGTDTLMSNIGDFFRDDDENNQYDAGEFIYKRNASGATCAASSFKFPNIAGTCDNGLDAVIREQLLFTFSHDTPTVHNLNLTRTKLSFKLFGNSLLTAPLPSNSQVAVEAEDYTDNGASCSAIQDVGHAPTPAIFDLATPSSFVNSDQVYYEYTLRQCVPGDRVVLVVTAPNGKISRVAYAVP